MDKICIVGSLNIDLTAKVDEFALPGQTVHGKSLDYICGGKGGNQAIAASKMGIATYMFGMMGNDIYASMYERNFERAGTHYSYVETCYDASTGTALIEVDKTGENRITIIDGANGCVTPEYIMHNSIEITKCKYLLLQLEIPMESVVCAAKIMKEAGGIVILDPAPAKPLPLELLKNVDYITPNESEIDFIAKGADIKSSCESLLALGAGAVICTMGNKGLYYVDAQKTITCPAYDVELVDTIGAGDCFNAGLASALCRGYSVEEALKYANAAGALAVQGAGAQNDEVSHHAIMNFLTSHPN
ncbi:MAG: ribokinase [Clostridiales bacterium]|nr:ribokinase [Clostridiales bacterium]